MQTRSDPIFIVMRAKLAEKRTTYIKFINRFRNARGNNNNWVSCQLSGPPNPKHQEATPILSRLILCSQPKSSNLIVFPTAPPISANELRFAGIHAAAKYRFTVLVETPRAEAISLSLRLCDRRSRARAGFPLVVPDFRP